MNNKVLALFQVCGDGKALLDTLQTPVSSSSANSITAKADYSEAAGHVLDVVHEVSNDAPHSRTANKSHPLERWPLFSCSRSNNTQSIPNTQTKLCCIFCALCVCVCVCVQCAGLPSIPRTHLAHRENCALSVYSRGVLYVLCRYLYIKKATRRHFELRESHAFVYAVCVGPSKNKNKTCLAYKFMYSLRIDCVFFV